MGVRAEAFQEYNQAAVIDKLLTGMPEMVRAMSEPLSKVDKITVVSTGNGQDGQGAGVNRLTSDMTTMIAQVPALLESLTGIRVDDLMRQVPQIRGAMDDGANGTSNGHRQRFGRGRIEDGGSGPKPNGGGPTGGSGNPPTNGSENQS